MACCTQGTVLSDLKSLINQVDDGCCPGTCSPETCSPCPPCCPPMCKPFAQVCMTCPPPILAPTAPQPVKPLRLPCPVIECPEEIYDPAERSRYANFYNNYNEDWHKSSNGGQDCCCPERPREKMCEDYTKPKCNECGPLPGCPTGFKPCTMKLTGPPNCDPNGIWCAQIQPCPPKPKKITSNEYNPGPCNRPCCKHWEPKEGPCLYDGVCKADCFNHPPGIKPSGRYP